MIMALDHLVGLTFKIGYNTRRDTRWLVDLWGQEICGKAAERIGLRRSRRSQEKPFRKLSAVEETERARESNLYEETF